VSEDFSIPDSMTWVGADPSQAPCEHPPGARESVVDGYVGCANCGAFLVPKAQAEAGLEAAVAESEETQTRFRVRGSVKGLSIVGEFEDEAAAVAAWSAAKAHGLHVEVFRVTTEKL